MAETKQYTVERDGERPLRFQGELIAEAGTSPERSRSDWSGETGRWVELRLYRTAKGKYVAERVRRTQWQGERDSREAWTAATPEEVVERLGLSRPAKELYAEAGLDCAEVVE